MATDAAPVRAGRDPAGWLQLALVVAGEAIWLLAWSQVAGSWLMLSGGAPLLPAWAIAALLIGAVAGSRLLGQRRTTRGARLGLAALGVALALAAGLAAGMTSDIDWGIAWRWVAAAELPFRPAATAALALLAWWRGLVIGQALLSLDEVEAAFRRDVGALLVLAIVNVFMPAGIAAPAGTLIGPALGVLATGLLGLPLARLLDLRAAVARAGGPAMRLDRHWLGLLAATVVVLLAGALVIVTIVTFERLDTVFAWLTGPLDLLLRLVILILTPLAYVLDALVTYLRQFARPNETPEQPPGRPERGEPPLGLTVPADMEWVLVALRLALAVGLLIASIAFLTAAIMRFTDTRRTDEVDEDRDFVWSWAAVRAGLRQWWRGRFSQRAAPPLATAPPTAPPLARERWGPRELYRALLRLGAVAGRPRALAETPHEYARHLSAMARLAPGTPAVTHLTDLYSRARYGDETPPAAEVAAGHEALTSLEALVAAPDEPSPPDAGSA
jgi:hypothetical protein